MAETENAPAALARDRAQPAVGIHRDRVTDRFEERDVARGVGVRGRLREVDALRSCELGDRLGLRVAVEPTAESAMAFLNGLPVEAMREIVADALDSAFLPHVYLDALDLVARHRERGERSFIVSAALQEIVDVLVAELGLDGGIGSTAEVEDGAYTGRLGRRLDGSAKAEAVAELAGAESIDLAESTAYSDSASDVPFLEAVGHAVAVNPDRRLRAIAAERGWRVLRFSDKAFPAP